MIVMAGSHREDGISPPSALLLALTVPSYSILSVSTALMEAVGSVSISVIQYNFDLSSRETGLLSLRVEHSAKNPTSEGGNSFPLRPKWLWP